MMDPFWKKVIIWLIILIFVAPLVLFLIVFLIMLAVGLSFGSSAIHSRKLEDERTEYTLKSKYF